MAWVMCYVLCEMLYDVGYMFDVICYTLYVDVRC